MFLKSHGFFWKAPQAFESLNFSHGREKGAKNSYGSYPTEFVFEVKHEN
jgi:hypothetical protein